MNYVAFEAPTEEEMNTLTGETITLKNMLFLFASVYPSKDPKDRNSSYVRCVFVAHDTNSNIHVLNSSYRFTEADKEVLDAVSTSSYFDHQNMPERYANVVNFFMEDINEIGATDFLVDRNTETNLDEFYVRYNDNGKTRLARFAMNEKITTGLEILHRSINNIIISDELAKEINIWLSNDPSCRNITGRYTLKDFKVAHISKPKKLDKHEFRGVIGLELDATDDLMGGDATLKAAMVYNVDKSPKKDRCTNLEEVEELYRGEWNVSPYAATPFVGDFIQLLLYKDGVVFCTVNMNKELHKKFINEVNI